jgi:DNA-directed RNA polymerase subunit F
MYDDNNLLEHGALFNELDDEDFDELVDDVLDEDDAAELTERYAYSPE